jgi:predicted DNA-binding transcriptional regulator AlpA
MPDTLLTHDDELLTPEQLAKMIPGASGNVRTIERWRMTGTGPAFVKFGRRVVYRRSDVQAWIVSRRYTHTAAVPKRPKAAKLTEAR